MTIAAPILTKKSENQQTHLSFSISRSSLRNRILIPKYYDPELLTACASAEADFELHELSLLLAPGSQGSRLGNWIRREHYGSGNIPFVRTSDLNDWRIRPDYKKGVSEDIYKSVAERQDVQAGDILMVAHGTYLIGTVAIVTEHDLPLVLQDHVFRLRLAKDNVFEDRQPLSSYLLLAALSSRFVRRQIRARQFSADIIDKIGERHLEIKVALPRGADLKRNISDAVSKIISKQTKVRSEISELLSSDLRMTRERASARHGFSVSRQSLKGQVLIPKYYDPALAAALDDAEKLADRPWATVKHFYHHANHVSGSEELPFFTARRRPDENLESVTNRIPGCLYEAIILQLTNDIA